MGHSVAHYVSVGHCLDMLNFNSMIYYCLRNTILRGNGQPISRGDNFSI